MNDLNNEMNAARQPVVTIKNGEVLADSRHVAEFFEKQHKHVLRDIRELISKEPDLARSNFGPIKIKDLTGEATSHYEMDRRGFTVLAMGFTGEKALKWKLRYIDAFDAMEAELRNRPAIDPIKVLNDPSAMRGLRNRPWAGRDVIKARKSELVHRQIVAHPHRALFFGVGGSANGGEHYHNPYDRADSRRDGAKNQGYEQASQKGPKNVEKCSHRGLSLIARSMHPLLA